MSTKAELENKLMLEEELKKERCMSDDRYAIKLIEKIVFWLVGVVGGVIIVAIVNNILK